jgi:hypothetical protein
MSEGINCGAPRPAALRPIVPPCARCSRDWASDGLDRILELVQLCLSTFVRRIGLGTLSCPGGR